MFQPKLLFRHSIGFIILATILVVSLYPDEPDTHTPQNFLHDRQSRIVAEYIEKVLKRGDAVELLAGVKQTHAEIKNGQHNLEVVRINLLTLISIAENLINSQEYADKIPMAIELHLDSMEAGFEQFTDEVKSLPAVEINGTENEIYIPPEHDKIYNEKKKDLLDECYDMLETINARI